MDHTCDTVHGLGIVNSSVNIIPYILLLPHEVREEATWSHILRMRQGRQLHGSFTRVDMHPLDLRLTVIIDVRLVVTVVVVTLTRWHPFPFPCPF